MYVLQNNDMLFLSYFHFTISGDFIRHMLITIVNLSKIINYNQWFEKIIRFKICKLFYFDLYSSYCVVRLYKLFLFLIWIFF